MSKKAYFSVTQPRITAWLYLCLILSFVIALGIDALVPPAPHPAYVVGVVMLIIPFSLAFIWTVTFQIQVADSTIHVRRAFGLVNFKTDLSQIDHIHWKTRITRITAVQQIRVYTNKGQYFTVEDAMVGSNQMIRYLEQNVPAEKINRQLIDKG